LFSLCCHLSIDVGKAATGRRFSDIHKFSGRFARVAPFSVSALALPPLLQMIILVSLLHARGVVDEIICMRDTIKIQNDVKGHQDLACTGPPGEGAES
jgi:hypothetical protein